MKLDQSAQPNQWDCASKAWKIEKIWVTHDDDTTQKNSPDLHQLEGTLIQEAFTSTKQCLS